MSYVASIFHIVFATKHREKTIPLDMRKDLYAYIWSQLKKLNCFLICIGGIEDHVHILVNIHPSRDLSKVIQIIKSYSSSYMNNDPRFPFFKGWCEGYYACSIAPKDKSPIIDYINSQELHHGKRGFDSELQALCSYAGMEYDERSMR